jgi:Domain of unknown function (DUF4191)
MARDLGRERFKRLKQIRQTYRMAKRSDPRILWWSLGVIVLVLAVLVGLVLLSGISWTWLVVALPLAVLAGTIVFGRRAERAAYAQLEGQPGAAASALSTLRRGWIVTHAVAVNRNQDMVHRVIGRPGIVLVGEGNPHRVAQLLASERKRHQRVAYDVPVHDIIVGTGDGQVPLRGLGKRVTKLPRKLRPSEVTELNNRLRALQTMPVPIPKGPLPRNLKLPKGGLQGGGRR